MSTPGEPVAPSAPDDDERGRLELEKLRLETQSLRDSTDRDALTTEKLRNDIAESKHAPRRALLSTFATILLGIGTIALSGAGFVLNTTISRAADHQRDFDNYSKLTEQFSKGGSARVGAIVGFQKLLGPGSSYATQVATVLANDLFEETDPVAVHAIVTDLRFAGSAAFPQVRDVQKTALLRFHNDAAQYTAGTVDPKRFQEGVGGPPSSDVRKAATKLRDAAYNDFSRREGTQFYNSQVGPVFNELVHLQQPTVSNLIKNAGAPVERRPDWLARYVRDSATVYESSIILRSLLESAARPEELDASGVWLLDVDWTDRGIGQVHLFGSYVSGRVDGADFSNADLSFVRLVHPYLKPSSKYVTSFCGAQLDYAEIGNNISDERSAATTLVALDDFRVDEDAGDLPDFTGSNWWTMHNLTPQARAVLQRRYPKGEQERLRKLPRDEQIRLCAERRRTGIRRHVVPPENVEHPAGA